MARPLFIADLTVSSPDLPTEGVFPDRFTAYFTDEMPRIVISGLPEGTVDVALIAHDPDAPRPRGFTHWAVYGIPPQDPFEVGPATIDTLRVGPNGRGRTPLDGAATPHRPRCAPLLLLGLRAVPEGRGRALARGLPRRPRGRHH